MARKRKSGKDSFGTEPSSWRTRIAQTGSRKATTATARWRLWKRAFKIAGALLLGCLLVAGGVFLAKLLSNSRIESPPLRHIHFRSDGVLDQVWIESAINIAPGTPLMDIDIHALQKSLSNVGQIRLAEVKRILPERLLIRVSEHEPLLRVVVRGADGGRMVYLVSRNGHVYRGQNYSNDFLVKLPYLTGIALRRDNSGGYLPVEGIPAVAEFLDLAYVLTPDLFATWNYIDLSGYHGNPRAVGSEIRVRTKGGAEIVFAPENFPMQLERLHEIATRRLNAEQRERVQRIDLSLPDPVVRLAERRGQTSL